MFSVTLELVRNCINSTRKEQATSTHVFFLIFRKEDEHYIFSLNSNQKTPPTQAVKEQIIATKEVSESINSLKHKDESSEENKDNKDKDSKNEDHGVPVKEFIGADSNTSGIDNLEEQFNEISDDDNDVSAGDLQAKISDTEDFEDVKTGEQLYDEEYVEEKVDDGNLAKSGAQALKVSANDDYEAFETLQD